MLIHLLTCVTLTTLTLSLFTGYILGEEQSS
jgi:hypothetical protein